MTLLSVFKSASKDVRDRNELLASERRLKVACCVRRAVVCAARLRRLAVPCHHLRLLFCYSLCPVGVPCWYDFGRSVQDELETLKSAGSNDAKAVQLLKVGVCVGGGGGVCVCSCLL